MPAWAPVRGGTARGPPGPQLNALPVYQRRSGVCVDRGWCHHNLSLYLICLVFFDGKILFQSGLTMTNEGMRFPPVCFVCVCVYG